DKAGAAKLDHAAIAKLAAGKLGAGDWYGQMVAVSYERARGIRALNQKCDGEFSVSVSKVVPAPLAQLFKAATAGGWFPKGSFEETSRTADKYWRGKWKTGRKLEFGFTAKGDGKSQIALEIGNIPSEADVEKARATWKKAMEKLTAMLA
ncbi:MAG TPA: hypothetical protein VIJ85_02960, partial [Rhizomicrobium sp.]